MKTLKLSTGGGSALGGKKLMLSMMLAITAGLLLFSETGHAKTFAGLRYDGSASAPSGFHVPGTPFFYGGYRYEIVNEGFFRGVKKYSGGTEVAAWGDAFILDAIDVFVYDGYAYVIAGVGEPFNDGKEFWKLTASDLSYVGWALFEYEQAVGGCVEGNYAYVTCDGVNDGWIYVYNISGNNPSYIGVYPNYDSGMNHAVGTHVSGDYVYVWCGADENPEWTRHEIIYVYTIRGHLEYTNGVDIVGATVDVGGYPVQTNGSGDYVLNNVPAGPWYVIAPSGYDWIPPTRHDFTITTEDVVDKDFTSRRHSISGTARKGDGTTLSGIDIYLDNQYKTSTLGDGTYTIAGLINGEYDVEARENGYTFDPLSRTVSLSTTNRTGQDFYTYDISGYIRRYGTGEGINGVNVNITGGEAGINETVTTTTGLGGDGYYILEHIGSGDYTIQPSNP